MNLNISFVLFCFILHSHKKKQKQIHFHLIARYGTVRYKYIHTYNNALNVLYWPNLDGQIFNLIFRSTSAIVWPYNICVVCECFSVPWRRQTKRWESSTWTFNARSMCVHNNILIFVILFPFISSLSLTHSHPIYLCRYIHSFERISSFFMC